MTAKEIINNIQKELLKWFEPKHALQKMYELEESQRGRYHGRELFELLQNVDDAYEALLQKDPSKRTNEVKALFSYKNNILCICNTGTKFTSDTIERLCIGGASDKTSEIYIGNKGTGFRSVLNWAEKIKLFSGDYAVCFSKEIAAKTLDSIKTNKNVKASIESLEKNKKIIAEFPMLYAPQFIEEKPPIGGYDTIIEITLNSAASDESDQWNIINQIDEFDKNILLFLPNITEIIFEMQDSTYTFKKHRKENNIVCLQKISDTNEILENDEFIYFDRKENITSNDKENTLKMALAIPANTEQDEKEIKMYTFFPIRKVNSPFPAILHATFELSDERDSINSDPKKLFLNKLVFKSLLKFYVEMVTKHFLKKEHKNRAVTLLCPNGFRSSYKFASPFNSDEIWDYYLDLCRENAGFLTVNDEFIKVSDSPKIIDDDFFVVSDVFKGKPFSDLLFPIDDEAKEFAKCLFTDNYEYSDEELCSRINELADKLICEERIKTFIWWSEQNRTVLPHLLKDKNQKYIETGSTCFFSGEISDIPDWVSFTFLDKKDEQTLVAYCSEHCKEKLEQQKNQETDSPKRLTIRFLNSRSNVKFREYTLSDILSPLNTEVGDDISRAKDFVRFLYRNFDTIKKVESAIDGIAAFRFPSAENSVENATQLYFGEEYGNLLSEKILKLAGYKKICPPTDLGLGDDVERIKEFLKRFKVAEYPRLTEIKLDWKESDYHSILRNTIGEYYNLEVIKVLCIENIRTVLEKISMDDVLKWIYLCNELRTRIKVTTVKENITIRRYKARYDSADIYSGEVSCYLNYIFSTTKWLEIDEVKYAPSECLFSDDPLLYKYTPCITDEYLESIRGKFKIGEIKEILSQLGVKTKEIDLPSQLFYSLLLKLQTDDKTERIVHRIYREAVEKKHEYDDSPAKNTFFAQGKVWTKKNGYQPVSDVFFSNKAVVNLDNKNLISLPLRTGAKETVLQIFNVHEYEEKYTINYDSIRISNHNADFQNDFKNYIYCAFCFRIDTASDTEKKKFKNLNIELVTHIKLDNNDNQVEPYTLIPDLKDDSRWFILVDDAEQTVYDKIKNKIAMILPDVFSVLLNSENRDELSKYRELFTANKEGRELLLIDRYDSLAILDESRKILGGIASDKEKILTELKKHQKDTDEIKLLLDSISFSNFSRVENQKNLFLFLQTAGFDISDMRSWLERDDVSMKKYLSEKAKNIFSKYKNNFKYCLFLHLYKKDVSAKKQFLYTVDEYETYADRNDNEIEDTAYFDEKQMLNKAFQELTWQCPVKETEVQDVDKNAKENRNKFLDEYDDAKNIVDKFLASLEMRSLLYFDFSTIEDEFASWKSQKEIEEKKEADSECKTFSNECSVDEPVPVISYTNKEAYRKKQYKGMAQYEKRESEELKQEQGDSAEQIVYNKLQNKNQELSKRLNIILDDYDVVWCSEASARAGNNPFGRDDLGYDIELTNKISGEKLYIDVKSSIKKECEFDMSKNEYDFAKEHADCYRIIFVGNMNKSGKKVSLQVLSKDITSSNYEHIPKKYMIRYIG